jgi:hypothetical protein
VTFAVNQALPGPDACHCTQCRKFSGHYFTSTDVPKMALEVSGGEHVRWYFTGKVRRGFCSTCGSSLFWDPVEKDWIGVAMGAFDGATDTHTHIHVHVCSKGDYYDITDALPQRD